MWLTVLILALNFGISWLNCRAVGGIWREAKYFGGWLRVLAWCGAIQSVIGFSSVIGAAAGYALYASGHLPLAAARAASSLWYLIVVLPAIGTGIAITVHSWIVAFRTKRFLDMGTAAYNTFAQIANMRNAFGGGISDALSVVTQFFTSSNDDKDDSSPALLVVVLVAFALAGGAILTAVLIKHYSRRLALPRHSA